jgi:hypothetical protein
LTWTSWYWWATSAMLALAFLTIAALAEHAQPPPARLIPLTRNEIAHLTAACSSSPPATPATSNAGPTGAGTTSTPPAPATISARPATTHNDLLLEY